MHVFVCLCIVYQLYYQDFSDYLSIVYLTLSCSFGGGNNLPINLHEINCQGNETKLINCDYEVYAHFYCYHSENVAITCNGELNVILKS